MGVVLRGTTEAVSGAWHASDGAHSGAVEQMHQSSNMEQQVQQMQSGMTRTQWESSVRESAL